MPSNFFEVFMASAEDLFSNAFDLADKLSSQLCFVKIPQIFFINGGSHKSMAYFLPQILSDRFSNFVLFSGLNPISGDFFETKIEILVGSHLKTVSIDELESEVP
jgi:hypothetical protein